MVIVMAFNSYAQALMTPAQINQIVDDRLAAKSKDTIWWNPVTKQYFLANNPASQEPDYGIAITRPGALQGLNREIKRPATSQLMGGSANPNISANQLDDSRYKGIWTPEFENHAVEFFGRLDNAVNKYYQTRDLGAFLGGGIVTSDLYSSISSTTIGNVMVDQEVLDLVTRDFILIDAGFSKRSWDKTTFTFDNRTPYSAIGGLGEFDVIPSGNIIYERGSISLKKAEARVDISIWANMAILDHDVVNDTTSIIDADFPRIFNTDGATTLTGFADQATGGAYDIIAGGAFHSTTNPSVRFDADSLSIRTAGGKASVLAMNTKGYRALVQNTFMRLSGSPTLSLGQEIPAVHAFTTTHQLLPGYKIIVDELVTDDNLFIYDPRTAIFIEGPTSLRRVPQLYGTVEVTVSDRWYSSGLKKSTWGVEETNIHS